jgi:DNA-binding Lrp family transcriptional regulator
LTRFKQGGARYARRRGESTPIDAVERAIIDHLQGGFPICERPYAEVAARLGMGEAELLERLQRMLEARLLTRFGPMFQVERMGGTFVLAALCVPEADWQRVLEVVNALPEVAHNYRRESEHNAAVQHVVRAGHESQARNRCRRAHDRGGQRLAGFFLPETPRVLRRNETDGAA